MNAIKQDYQLLRKLKCDCFDQVHFLRGLEASWYLRACRRNSGVHTMALFQFDDNVVIALFSESFSFLSLDADRSTQFHNVREEKRGLVGLESSNFLYQRPN